MVNEHGLQDPDVLYCHRDTRSGHVRRLAREHQNDIDQCCILPLASSELFLYALHYLSWFVIRGSILTSSHMLPDSFKFFAKR